MNLCRTIKQLIIGLLVLSGVCAQGQTVTIRTITIEPFLSHDDYEHFARLILNSPDSHADLIEGFSFDWGYKYKLSVKETKLDERLSDGTLYEYSLDHIISKTRVPDSTEFKLAIDPYLNSYGMSTLDSLNDSTYLYFEEVEIEVPESLRAKVKLIAEGKVRYQLGTFIFIDDKRIRLIHL